MSDEAKPAVETWAGKRVTKFEAAILEACKDLNVDEEDLQDVLIEVRAAIRNHRYRMVKAEQDIYARLAEAERECDAMRAQVAEECAALKEAQGDRLKAQEHAEWQMRKGCELFEWMTGKGVSPDVAAQAVQTWVR